jgi:hypothetical protein
MRIQSLSSYQITNAILKVAISAGVLALSFILGYKASLLWLALPVAGVGFLILLRQPILGLMLLTVVALVIPINLNTGTAIVLNPATLLVPAIGLLWLLEGIRRRELRLVPSRTNRPLMFFLLAGILSLLIGSAIWDPAVPRSSSFVLVQVAQWAIFAFSAMAYWLMGNLVPDETWLRRITFLFLGVGGCLGILFVIPGVGLRVGRIATHAINRAPFWMLLTALPLGQLLFNKRLSTGWRILLILSLVAVLVYTLYWQRDAVSTWIGIAAVVGLLGWFRWPQLRWPVIILILVLASTGLLSSAVYDFAGGEEEWEDSGGSRMVLIGRVLEVSLRNPITGLGPAAYRNYAAMKPLTYQRALWINPKISSHNNYVDLFSHVGLVGMGLLFWFVIEVTNLGLRLRTHFKSGFSAGYVNSMLAAGGGALTLMLFADWMLPYVYNIGFPGFQASVLVWLFMGGLVALEQQMNRDLAQ